jgi:integrase
LIGIFKISATRDDLSHADHTLWPWRRETAWRFVKATMHKSGIIGRCACPRGLRHAFVVGSLQSRAPLNLVQRWLGHTRINFIGTIPDSPIALTKLAKRLGKEGQRLEFCYEAGCCGYVIYRHHNSG